MRRLIIFFGCFLMLASTGLAGEGRVIKVLPQFIDKQGRHALSPSLFDRDAYQAVLRKHPELRSALRFVVQWKGKPATTAPFTIRVEIRGAATDALPKSTALEQTVQRQHWYGSWAFLDLSETDYAKLGEVTAWRVTLWDGKQLLSEQRSLLW